MSVIFAVSFSVNPGGFFNNLLNQNRPNNNQGGQPANAVDLFGNVINTIGGLIQNPNRNDSLGIQVTGQPGGGIGISFGQGGNQSRE